MFCVLADDLTGAAELAGITLKFGLTSEIKNEFSGPLQSDVLVVNTKSRIVDEITAAKINKNACHYMLPLNPDWIFKKTDSVLRGHVRIEIQAILDACGIRKCLLIPANPRLGRTMVAGKYYINDIEIAQTAFADDPDYPCKTSDVLSLLGKDAKSDTAFLNKNQELPSSGIFIGQVKDEQSVIRWANRVDDQLLPAGAAEFFTKILLKKGFKYNEDVNAPATDYGKILFVCGSSHENSRLAVAQAGRQGAAIFSMPEKLIYNMDNNLLEKWQWDIKAAFNKSDKVILTVADQKISSKETARRIQNVFARTIALLLLRLQLNTLVVEGGETAQEITKRLKIDHFFPKNLLAAGVVELQTKTENPATVIIKPGSYKWPESLWHFN